MRCDCSECSDDVDEAERPNAEHGKIGSNFIAAKREEIRLEKALEKRSKAMKALRRTRHNVRKLHEKLGERLAGVMKDVEAIADSSGFGGPSLPREVLGERLKELVEHRAMLEQAEADIEDVFSILDSYQSALWMAKSAASSRGFDVLIEIGAKAKAEAVEA